MSGQQSFTFGSSSSSSSSSFHGSSSSAQGTKKPFFFFSSFDQDDHNLLDDGYFLKQEKKRKLRDDQVEFLEKSFEMENMKLEHDTKLKLAKDLGLQPRQVSIWFQNRRVRWKNKQMEKDYDDLETDYNALKVNYENLHKEKARLENEVTRLKEELKMKDDESQKILLPACEQDQDQEVSFSMKNGFLDSDSPHSINGDHSSNQDPGCSWHVLDNEEDIDPFLDFEAQIFGFLPLF